MARDLFGEVPERLYPEWFTPSKYAKGCAYNALLGRHPFGFELGPGGSRCGGCRHVRSYERNTRVFHKCAKYRDTCGPATDLRLKWRACIHFEEDE